MSFLNKVVIVTGGSSGIGASTAIQFAKEGANVTIVGRNESNLKQVAHKISQVGNPALVVKADVTKDEEAKQVIKKTVEKFGKIDVLVNNAGSTLSINIEEDNFIESYDFVVNTNLRSAVFLSNSAIPYLKQTKGNIVNISSVVSKTVACPGVTAYSVSKAGLDQLTKNSAFELAEFGIRVNSVSPGPVDTPFFDKEGVRYTDYQAIVERETALKIKIQPEEVADIVVYLASEKARSITGSDYIIDGGYLINSKKNDMPTCNSN